MSYKKEHFKDIEEHKALKQHISSGMNKEQLFQAQLESFIALNYINSIWEFENNEPAKKKRCK